MNKILRWPKKPSDKDVVVKYLATKIKLDKHYTEQEINEIIKKHHLFNDTPLLRRELISRKYNLDLPVPGLKKLFKNKENIKFVQDALFGATNEPMGTSYTSRFTKPEYIYA